MDVNNDKIENSVLDFLKRCSNKIGEQSNEEFNINTWHEYYDFDISSPIEQLFYCALKFLAESNHLQNGDPIEVCGKMYCYGLRIHPQEIIGNYRVDFLVEWHAYPHFEDGQIQQKIKKVIVECDSQEFHERSEKERRYEKKRDRFFATNGIHSFHFTGKEIKENPFVPGSEVLKFLTGRDIEYAE